jgi:hypothetical protein
MNTKAFSWTWPLRLRCLRCDRWSIRPDVTVPCPVCGFRETVD